MSNSTAGVAYLVFDIETVADGQLVSQIRYPGQCLTPDVALARYRAELLEQNGRDILPPTYMLPISVAVAKLSADYRIIDLTVLDPPAYRPHVITRRFWQGWQHYPRPPFVTFKGRDGVVVHEPDGDTTLTTGNARKPARIRRGRWSRLLPKNWFTTSR